MTILAVERFSQGLKDWYKAMTRMYHLSVLDALRAVIPVWTVQALVTHTVDEFFATITNSSMASVSAGVAKKFCHGRKDGISGSSLKGMPRMVAVPVADMAVEA